MKAELERQEKLDKLKRQKDRIKKVDEQYKVEKYYQQSAQDKLNIKQQKILDKKQKEESKRQKGAMKDWK